MIHIKQLTTTSKVVVLLNSGKYNKTELSNTIGIGRPTLDKRLSDHSWKKGEMEIIKSL